MAAPEVKQIADVFVAAGREVVWTMRASWLVARMVIQFARAKEHFGGAIFGLAPARIPPAQIVVGAGRALADQQGAACAISNVLELDARIKKKDTVSLVVVCSPDAK